MIYELFDLWNTKDVLKNCFCLYKESQWGPEQQNQNHFYQQYQQHVFIPISNSSFSIRISAFDTSGGGWHTRNWQAAKEEDKRCGHKDLMSFKRFKALKNELKCNEKYI